MNRLLLVAVCIANSVVGNAVGAVDGAGAVDNVCWERRREVACYPCMCVAASQRFPLILHLTPRLRGDTPSPRRLNV